MSTKEQMFDGDTILIDSAYFLGCLWPGSFIAEDVDVKNTCTKSVYAKITCTGTINAVKYLKIHSQSSWILELRQFDTRFEIGIVADW